MHNEKHTLIPYEVAIEVAAALNDDERCSNIDPALIFKWECVQQPNGLAVVKAFDVNNNPIGVL